MHIVHVASELAPIAKAGGLGDVVYGLSKCCMDAGHTISIILPYYDILDEKPLRNLKLAASFGAYEAYTATLDDLPLTLLKLQGDAFDRGSIYGGVDEIRRFLQFTQATLAYFEHADIGADILHLHDWPVSPLLYYLPKGRFTASILSIHNLFHQGHATLEDFTSTGLTPPSGPHTHDNQADVNILRSALHLTDHAVAVSPTYAGEIKTKALSDGLHDTIIENQYKISGVLNGIDTDYWNPETDPHLIAPFSDDTVASKRENRRALLQELKIKPGSGPLVCAITRLVPQKSPKLIARAARFTLENDGVFILLGTTDDPNLRALFPPHPRLHTHFTFDEALAHRTYAGADAIVIPSKFEPCGLTQMIALRYGTLPIARKTGGLSDTVFESPAPRANGFLFKDLKEEALDHALSKAFLTFHKHQDLWQARIARGLKTDFSWKKPTQEYLKLYTSLTKHRE